VGLDLADGAKIVLADWAALPISPGQNSRIRMKAFVTLRKPSLEVCDQCS